MVFLKKIEVRCQKDRYGGTQRGLFALEPITKGERVWYCDCGEKDGTYTRVQLLAIINKHPHLDYFIRSFSYMVDDDLYALPHTYLEEKNNDECALFNHSCDPTCGLHEDAFGDNVVAIRDIDVGEELTYHYGVLETEASLILGMKCKCSSPQCLGILTFDYYRDADFVAKFFDYMTPYLKQKVLDMKTRWYSRSCYVKRYPLTSGDKSKSSHHHLHTPLPICPNDSTSTTSSNSSSSSSSEDISLIENDEVVYEKGLTSLIPIKKGELVAKFTPNEHGVIDPTMHFIRNAASSSSVNVHAPPNCIVIDGNVFANQDIPDDVELTIDFNMINAS